MAFVCVPKAVVMDDIGVGPGFLFNMKSDFWCLKNLYLKKAIFNLVCKYNDLF